MKIQYASDLHLEFYEGKHCDDEFFKTLVNPVSGVDLLVLAGDIGYPEMTITKEFMTWCCAHWSYVIWVFGNHEYYNESGKRMTMNEKEGISIQYMHQLHNLHVLHNDVFHHPDFPELTVIGSTLWTEIPKDMSRVVSKYMSDCRYIITPSFENFTIEDWNKIYAQNIQFISREIDHAEKEKKKVLVITHHLPTYKCILPEYRGSDLNCAFASNAGELLENPVVAAWICGHSHGQLDLNVMNRIGKDTLVTFNARGYPREMSTHTYNPTKVLEL